MAAIVPLAALAAALLFLGGKKAEAQAPVAVKPAAKKPAPKGTVTLGKPYVVKPAPASEALQAAMLADKQLGKPKTSAQMSKSNGKAQVAPAHMPPGYSRAAAQAKAQPTADHIRTRKTKYDRATLQSFQTSAGLKADGLYGPQTRNALVFFGAKNVPGAIVKGTNAAYNPPAGG